MRSRKKLNSDVDTASAFMRRTLPYPLPCNQNRRFVRFDISGDILGPSSKDRASTAFRSAGDMAERIGSFGWGATSIGPVSSWPHRAEDTRRSHSRLCTTYVCRLGPGPHLALQRCLHAGKSGRQWLISCARTIQNSRFSTPRATRATLSFTTVFSILERRSRGEGEDDFRRSLKGFEQRSLHACATLWPQERVFNFRIGKQMASQSAWSLSRPVTLAREIPQGDISDRRDSHARWRGL